MRLHGKQSKNFCTDVLNISKETFSKLVNQKCSQSRQTHKNNTANYNRNGYVILPQFYYICLGK